MYKSHMVAYINSGECNTRIDLSYFEAIDLMYHEMLKCEDPEIVVTVLEFLTDWQVTIKERNPHEKMVGIQRNKKAKIKYERLNFMEAIWTEAFNFRKLSDGEVCALMETLLWIPCISLKEHLRSVGKYFAIDTQMDQFKCTQCGKCCLGLGDAHMTPCHPFDLKRWLEEKRSDILAYTDGFDLWFSPKTGEDVSRCPWVRKLPNQKKYKCRIHDTKPRHCFNFPKSKLHALMCDCEGFPEKPKSLKYYFEKYRKI